MEIQRNISSIFEKEKVIAVDLPKNIDSGKPNMISGFRSGKEIYQPPLNLLNAVGTYCHEVGHILGDRTSFQSGLKWWNKKYILGFDEIKHKNVSIDLDDRELDYAKKYMFHKRKLHIKNEVLSISQKLLKTLFKGKFSEQDADLYSISYRKLNKLVADRESSTTLTKTENGLTKIVIENSKGGRNSELPAILTEASCLLILENTLIKHKVMSETNYITMVSRGSAPHQRAQNIIARAHAGRGWRIPSMMDIYSK